MKLSIFLPDFCRILSIIISKQASSEIKNVSPRSPGRYSTLEIKEMFFSLHLFAIPYSSKIFGRRLITIINPPHDVIPGQRHPQRQEKRFTL